MVMILQVFANDKPLLRGFMGGIGTGLWVRAGGNDECILKTSIVPAEHRLARLAGGLEAHGSLF